MARANPLRVENLRWVEAVEIFHSLYIAEGPYKSNVPRLVREIVARLEGGEDLQTRLLSEFGRRGGKSHHRRSSSSIQHSLFPGDS